jgi:hypothetical protein
MGKECKQIQFLLTETRIVLVDAEHKRLRKGVDT